MSDQSKPTPQKTSGYEKHVDKAIELNRVKNGTYSIYAPDPNKTDPNVIAAKHGIGTRGLGGRG